MDQQFRQVEAQENQSSVSAASYRGEVASQGQVGGAFEEGFDSPSIVSPLKSVPKPMRVLGYLILGYCTLALSFYAFSESALKGAERNLGITSTRISFPTIPISPEAQNYKDVFKSLGNKWAGLDAPQFMQDSIPALDYTSAAAFRLACTNEIQPNAQFAAIRAQLGTPTNQPLQFGSDNDFFPAQYDQEVTNWSNASYIFDLNAMAEAGQGHPQRAVESAGKALAFANQLSGAQSIEAQLMAAVDQRYAYSMYAGILSMYGNRADVRAEIAAHLTPQKDQALTPMEYQEAESIFKTVGTYQPHGAYLGVIPKRWLGLKNLVPGIGQWQQAHFLDLTVDDYRAIQAAEEYSTVTGQLSGFAQVQTQLTGDPHSTLNQPLGEVLRARFERDDWRTGVLQATDLLSKIQPTMTDLQISHLINADLTHPQEHQFKQNAGSMYIDGNAFATLVLDGLPNQTLLWSPDAAVNYFHPRPPNVFDPGYASFHIELPATLWHTGTKPK